MFIKFGNIFTKEIKLSQNQIVAISSSTPSEHEMMVFKTMSKAAQQSKFYKQYNESDIMMIMLSAREFGISPCQALNGGLNIINGKVEISARMMNALIRRAGHDINIIEISPKHCIIQGKRSDTQKQLTTSFTIDEAIKAGLVRQGGGWTKWPMDMCFARALSRLARQLFSDVIGIGYVEGEIQETNVKPDCSEEDFKGEEIIIENQFTMEKILEMFPVEDHEKVKEYVKKIKLTFNFTDSQCIQKCIENENLIVNFNKWKERNEN